MYVLKLFLNVITAESKAFVISKKSSTCLLSHVLYCKTLKEMCRDIQNKMYGNLTTSVVLFHDNTHLHTVTHTGAFQLGVT
jgi:hypothetical protein